jgi:predicted transcriptional regulator
MEAKDYVLALKDSGLTQMQIEKITGIPQSSISKIETGTVSDVMSKTYRALQAAYNDMLQQEKEAA